MTVEEGKSRENIYIHIQNDIRISKQTLVATHDKHRLKELVQTITKQKKQNNQQTLPA